MSRIWRAQVPQSVAAPQQRWISRRLRFPARISSEMRRSEIPLQMHTSMVSVRFGVAIVSLKIVFKDYLVMSHLESAVNR